MLASGVFHDIDALVNGVFYEKMLASGIPFTKKDELILWGR